MIRWLVFVATTALTLINLKIISPLSYVSAEVTTSAVIIGKEQDDLFEMLNTEKVLIDTLGHYIETQEQKLNLLKRRTFEIRHIHDNVTDRDKYLHNPINALTILKRFTEDWKALTSYAEDYLEIDDLAEYYNQQAESLLFPSDEDYDAAVANLLRIQDMYQLEAQSLAAGEVNGVKLGSEMTWRDCLEVGLQSSKNGYVTSAKYWMETALQKVPNKNDTNQNYNSASASTNQGYQKSLQHDYTVKEKLKIMEALLSIEYKLGNLKDALKLANEMLAIQPQQKYIIETKNEIENILKNGNSKKDEKRKKKNIKTVEEMMIEEICREAISLQNHKQIHSATTNPHTPSCTVVTNNLPFLLLQPVKFELLSLDPYIVIYHNAISDTQIDELRKFVFEREDGTFELTNIGQKKMRQITSKLLHTLGHYGRDLYDNWQVELHSFEILKELQKTAENYDNSKQAMILFNLQQPIMGGALIFPQLQLSINLPRGSLLYWSTLNEFHTHDYRSNYHVCSVIGGSQITATTSIKKI